MKEKIVCALSYLWILFFLPLVLLPGDKKGKFHANQALLNFIIGVVCVVIGKVLGWIPLIGWIVGVIVWLVPIVCTVWGIYCALTDQEKPYPFIGHITIFK